MSKYEKIKSLLVDDLNCSAINLPVAIERIDQIYNDHRLKNKYITLLAQTLTDYNKCSRPEYRPLVSDRGKLKIKLLLWFSNLIRRKGFAICRYSNPTKKERFEGRIWAANADTMIGMKRMDNLIDLVGTLLEENIPGDLIETGVWRGGATIMMNALLHEFNQQHRKIFVCDSFEGLPRPDGRYKQDQDDKSYMYNELAVSLVEVQNNFYKYGLLTDNVRFVRGWFKDTLPKIASNQFALIRLDGDMYSSTMDALINLYPKLVVGGYCIIDDYGAIKECRQAVHDYRLANNITDDMIQIDWTGVYWRKEKPIY